MWDYWFSSCIRYFLGINLAQQEVALTFNTSVCLIKLHIKSCECFKFQKKNAIGSFWVANAQKVLTPCFSWTISLLDNIFLIAWMTEKSQRNNWTFHLMPSGKAEQTKLKEGKEIIKNRAEINTDKESNRKNSMKLKAGSLKR